MTGKIVWGKPGRDAETPNAFFDEVEGAAETIESVSMDLGPAYAKSVRARAPHATLCFDPFHVVMLATDAAPMPWTRCAARCGVRPQAAR